MLPSHRPDFAMTCVLALQNMLVDFSKPPGSRHLFPPSRQLPPVWEPLPLPPTSRIYQLHQVARHPASASCTCAHYKHLALIFSIISIAIFCILGDVICIFRCCNHKVVLRCDASCFRWRRGVPHLGQAASSQQIKAGTRWPTLISRPPGISGDITLGILLQPRRMTWKRCLLTMMVAPALRRSQQRSAPERNRRFPAMLLFVCLRAN